MLKYPRGDVYEKIKKSISIQNDIFDKKLKKLLNEQFWT